MEKDKVIEAVIKAAKKAGLKANVIEISGDENAHKIPRAKVTEEYKKSKFIVDFVAKRGDGYDVEVKGQNLDEVKVVLIMASLITVIDKEMSADPHEIFETAVDFARKDDTTNYKRENIGKAN